ncbi:MAG: YaaC family protein [Bacteroidota bacterium]|nr:YaaC family protein [Bacteroidota bacterium]
MGIGLKYQGSFQTIGIKYPSENPLSELWSRIDQLGSSAFLHNSIRKLTSDEEFEKLIEYSSLRIRQGVQFREASSGSRQLTSPLTLYYSYLNLTRAILALKTSCIPSKGHGLKLVESNSLLQCAAKTGEGTFQEYLKTLGVDLQNNTTFSLQYVLSHIVEFTNDKAIDRMLVIPPCAISIYVDAEIDGPVLLRFPPALKEFRNDWSIEFPHLKGICSLASEGNVLLVNQEFTNDNSYYEISKFCSDHLLPSLTIQEIPTWYLLRNIDDKKVLPRTAYYFIASFILGSLVRYQPESLQDAMDVNSEINWLIRRFISYSERFYPQLMLCWLYGKQIYF